MCFVKLPPQVCYSSLEVLPTYLNLFSWITAFELTLSEGSVTISCFLVFLQKSNFMYKPEFTIGNGQEITPGTNRSQETRGIGNALSRFESLIEGFVEDSLFNYLHTRGHPIEIAKKLARTMENETCIWLDGCLVAPDKYVVQLRPETYSVYRNVFEIMEQSLAEYIQNAAAESNPIIYFLKPPVVRLGTSSYMGRRRVLVDAYWGEDNQTRKAEQIANSTEQSAVIRQADQLLNYLEASLVPDKKGKVKQSFDFYEFWRMSTQVQRAEVRGVPILQHEGVRHLYAKLGRDKKIWEGVFEEVIKTTDLAGRKNNPSDLIKKIKIGLGIAEALGMNQDTQDPDLQPVKKVIDNLIAIYGTGNEFVWLSHAGDIPVRVTRVFGVGPDGREYVSVEGSNTGVPRDELRELQAQKGGLNLTSEETVSEQLAPADSVPLQQPPASPDAKAALLASLGISPVSPAETTPSEQPVPGPNEANQPEVQKPEEPPKPLETESRLGGIPQDPDAIEE